MYFDPGTGSAVIQLLVALVAMGGGVWFAFRKKIAAFFKNTKNANASERPKTEFGLAGDVEEMIDTINVGKPEGAECVGGKGPE